MQRSQWIILLFVVIFLVNMWKRNKKNNVAEAKDGEYSENNVYKNISPMKHDIFKQISIDILPMLIFGLITKDNFFSMNNFQESVVGKCVMSFIGFGMFYQFIQPHIINKPPNF